MVSSGKGGVGLKEMSSDRRPSSELPGFDSIGNNSRLAADACGISGAFVPNWGIHGVPAVSSPCPDGHAEVVGIVIAIEGPGEFIQFDGPRETQVPQVARVICDQKAIQPVNRSGECPTDV